MKFLIVLSLLSVICNCTQNEVLVDNWLDSNETVVSKQSSNLETVIPPIIGATHEPMNSSSVEGQASQVEQSQQLIPVYEGPVNVINKIAQRINDNIMTSNNDNNDKPYEPELPPISTYEPQIPDLTPDVNVGENPFYETTDEPINNLNALKLPNLYRSHWCQDLKKRVRLQNKNVLNTKTSAITTSMTSSPVSTLDYRALWMNTCYYPNRSLNLISLWFGRGIAMANSAFYGAMRTTNSAINIGRDVIDDIQLFEDQ